MPFTYDRTIHFADTDAAGVVFFANYLTICHEAYEESLLASGIDLKVFFADHRIVVPIAKSEADYSRPLSCGDKLRVSMQPALLSEDSYEIRFEITRLGPPSKRAARIRTEHVCVDSGTRARTALPGPLSAWVRAGRPPGAPVPGGPAPAGRGRSFPGRCAARAKCPRTSWGA